MQFSLTKFDDKTINMKQIIPFIPIIAILVFAACEAPPIDYNTLTEEQKHQPEHALAGMDVREGLQLQLFASEPMISNPTNMDIDARGRVWMIEAQNYRNKHNPDNPYRETGDKILILEDTNGDGKADSKKVFYQGEDINAALGIAILGNKVIVSHSPEVIIFTDLDGDDQPDSREILFANISGDQHDHAIHAFTFGPDGRLYFNMGNEGKQLTDKDGNPIKDRWGNLVNTQDGTFRQGLALRCEMDGSNVEVLGHNFRNPFELAVDSYGTLWQSDNDDDGNRGTRINYVMPYGNYGYTDEMTGAGWRTRRIGMHDSIPMRHWYLNDPGVVPNLLQTGSGSPTGILVYEGDLMPAVFHNQMIHCEPGHQVVRSYIAKPDGAGYTATVENIVKSKNKWFRPSDACVAPDGSIFVADWYDPGVGGHKMGDVERGRIYRIVPEGKEAYKAPAYNLSTPELAVQALQSPNLATRYLAWTALNEMGTKAESESALVTLYENGTPHLKARAFWLLAHQSKAYIQKALQAADANIQLAGLRAAQYLDEENLLDYIGNIEDKDAPQLRREAAIMLRHYNSIEAANLWANLALQYKGNDRWYLEALGIGSDLNAANCLQAWKTKVGDNWNTKANRDIIWRLRTPETIPMIAEILKDKDLDEQQIARFFRTLHFQPEVNKDQHLAALLVANHPEQKVMNAYTLSNLSPNYYKRSPQIVEKILPSIEGTPEWLDAVKSMKLTNQSPALVQMLLHDENKDMRFGAAQTLAATNEAGALQQLSAQLPYEEQEHFYQAIGQVGNDNAMAFLTTVMNDDATSPALRQLAASSLGNSWDGQHLLADLARNGKVEKVLQTAIGLKLINAWPPEIKEQGFRLLEAAKGKDGQELPPVKELAKLEGDALQGRYAFKTYCASCHQVNGEGIEFGPNLSEIGTKLAKRAIYEAIFYPSAGINFGYEGYLIKTKDGNTYAGYITSETETDLTLRMMGGVDQEIKTNNIASKEALEQSLMTANLPAAMSQEELVNLVEYLSELKTAEQLSLQ